MPTPSSETMDLRAALEQLGVQRFVLGIQARMFPAAGAWDSGFGAPLSPAGDRVLDFARALGFTALQLGPSGRISTANISPYDGTVFARNPWSIGIEALTGSDFHGLLDASQPDQLFEPASVSHTVAPQRANACLDRVLARCHAQLARMRAHDAAHPLLTQFETFRREAADWLELNACYEALAAHAGDDPSRFDAALRAMFEPGPTGSARRSALRATLGADIERAELAQFLAHAQHAKFRERARTRGLALWGDMQVGYSHRDRFLFASAFSPRWFIGAPPSRTNPNGQPWGYPLLDPSQLEDPNSPARRLFAQRIHKLLREYDGIRIDHPHGLVCPWIYASSAQDASAAVRAGTRAHESPDLHDPDLQAWAIARLSDLNPQAANRYADDWVAHIDSAQEARFAVLFDELVELCRAHGNTRDAIAAEVLSTCPYPLLRVLERHALGRFRVTQKANLADPADVYRTDRAQRDDWVMLGTHDTPTIFSVAQRWLKDGSAGLRAAYLAERLIADPAERAGACARMQSSVSDLLTASLADLFISGARSVYMFVGDLFGETEPFNRAGIVDEANWKQRLAPDFEQVYAERVREGRALDVARAARLALTRSFA